MSLFKFVEYLVEQVIKETAKQANVILEEIQRPLHNIVNDIKIIQDNSEDVWTGDGANRFVDEINMDVRPLVENIMGLITSFSKAIDKGAQRMSEAEGQADKKAMMLFGLFTGIF
jgi:uncharacterized protein YukE